MRRLLFFSIAYVGISLLACQDGTEENPILDRDLAHYRSIGKQIPNETGARWITAYRERESSAGRTNSFNNYSVGSANLQNLLSSVEGLTGVAFHHALDASGDHHFILIPVDETLGLWTSSEGKVFIDANSNTIISKETAQEWTANYEAANPGAIWFHFFGKDVFNEITAISYLDNLLIVPALNDLNLSPQLLLIVLNGDGLLDGLTGGRTDGLDDDKDAVYDASSPCPPCAVH